MESVCFAPGRRGRCTGATTTARSSAGTGARAHARSSATHTTRRPASCDCSATTACSVRRRGGLRPGADRGLGPRRGPHRASILRGHLFGVGDIALIPGTRRFVSAGDATLRLWDLEAASEGAILPLEPEVSWMLFLEARGWAISATETSDTVWVRTLEGRVVWKLADHGGLVSSIALSVDESVLACGVDDGSLHLWDLETGTRRWRCERHEAPIASLAFSPDGSLLASGGQDGRVCLSSTADGTVASVSRPHSDDYVKELAFSHDGRLVAAGGLGNIAVCGSGPRTSSSRRRRPTTGCGSRPTTGCCSRRSRARPGPGGTSRRVRRCRTGLSSNRCTPPRRCRQAAAGSGTVRSTRGRIR